MHSSVQRKDSGNKKGKSYKDLPFGPSGEIRTHGLMVPKVRNGVMVYHVLPHLLTAKPLCFQGFERFSI